MGECILAGAFCFVLFEIFFCLGWLCLLNWGKCKIVFQEGKMRTTGGRVRVGGLEPVLAVDGLGLDPQVEVASRLAPVSMST